MTPQQRARTASEASAPRTNAAPLSRADIAFYALAGVTLVLFVACIYGAFLYAPEERSMGVVQRIFYFHVPSAYAMYLGAAACFVGSIGYFLSRSDTWDALARAGAEMAVVFGAIVMTTGPLWGAKAWGYFWVWDPRLTTTLLSLLIYVAYLVLRAFAGDGQGERKFAALIGILGAANLPIIHFSVEKWAGQHPKVILAKGGGGLQHDMLVVFLLSMFTFTLFAVVLLWARVRLGLLEHRLLRAEQDAIDLGLDARTEG